MIDVVSLLVRDGHSGPLVRLQPQGLQGKVLDEVEPRITQQRLTHGLKQQGLSGPPQWYEVKRETQRSEFESHTEL